MWLLYRPELKVPSALGWGQGGWREVRKLSSVMSVPLQESELGATGQSLETARHSAHEVQQNLTLGCPNSTEAENKY